MNVETQLARARKIKDPIVRALRLNEIVLPAADELRTQVIDARSEAIVAAVAGSDRVAVGKLLGLSKGRIQQIEYKWTGRELYPGRAKK